MPAFCSAAASCSADALGKRIVPGGARGLQILAWPCRLVAPHPDKHCFTTGWRAEDRDFVPARFRLSCGVWVQIWVRRPLSQGIFVSGETGRRPPRLPRMSDPLVRPSRRVTGVYWPETGWHHRVSPALRIFRQVFPVVVVAGIVILAVAAIGLNTRTDGGSARVFIAGLAVPIGLGLVAIVVMLRLRLKRH
jgi:hypothetical protein